MRNFYTFETCKQSFISAFSICMTVPLSKLRLFVERVSLIIPRIILYESIDGFQYSHISSSRMSNFDVLEKFWRQTYAEQ